MKFFKNKFNEFEKQIRNKNLEFNFMDEDTISNSVEINKSFKRRIIKNNLKPYTVYLFRMLDQKRMRSKFHIKQKIGFNSIKSKKVWSLFCIF